MHALIAPRLSSEAIVTTARELPAWEVATGDRRLAHLVEWLCRLLVLWTPGATFVEWPDMSIGFVDCPPEDPQHAQALVTAYGPARESLEALALDFFYLFDRSRPH